MKLIDGSRGPENKEDDLFILGYQGGGLGSTLMSVYDNEDVISSTGDELHAFVLGYCIGQHTIHENNETTRTTSKKKYH